MIFEDFINAGMAYLDSKIPGWYNKVDLNTLDIGDASKGNCLLCQVTGVKNYCDALITLGDLPNNEDIYLGFSAARYWHYTEYYKTITTEWKEAIRARLQQERGIRDAVPTSV